MKKLIAMLLVLMLLLACLPGAALAADEAEGDAALQLELTGSGLTLSAAYRESDFFQSAYVYNHDLAWLTLCLELSAYSAETKQSWGEDGADDSGIAARRSANIADAYAKLGFDSVAYYNYGVSLNESEDKVAFSIGQKALSDGSTLVTAFIRGGGYGAEWVSNFNLTEEAMAQGYHQGFNDAADKVFAQLTETLKGIAGPVKVWITGYSRGAAAANLLAGKLDDYALTSDQLSPENIYAYTFATPCAVLPVKDPGAERYGNIFNIVNPGDLVPLVAPAAWSYGRYGVTKAFDVNASDAVLQSVDQIWDRYWKELPEGAFDVAGIKGVFTGSDAGKNVRMEDGFQRIMDKLTASYPTEDSARALMAFIRDMLLLGNQKELQDGSWKPVGTEKWLDMLKEKYGAENVETVYAAVQTLASEEPFVTLDMLLSTMGLEGYLSMFLTVGTLNGVEMHKVILLILKVLLIDAKEFTSVLTMADNFLGNVSWSDWVAGKGPGAMVTTTFSTAFQDGEALAGYARNFSDQVIFGHLPITYLAWLSQPEKDTFGFASEAPAKEGSESEAAGDPAGASGILSGAILDMGLISAEDYVNPVSRAKTSGLFVFLLETVCGESIGTILQERGLSLNYGAFSDTDDESVLAMNALGILKGVGGGKFDPEGTLTRAQLAAILNRIAKVLGVDTEGYTHSFTDVAGSWVDRELGWPASVGIFDGEAGAAFDPKGLVTGEAAITAGLRCLDALTAD